MHYVLDANMIIRSLNGVANTIQLLVTLAQQSHDPLCVSTVTQMDVWAGVHRAAESTAMERVYERFFADLTVLPFDSGVAKRAANLRFDLRRQSGRTREWAIDPQIALTARFGLELVTHNTQDFDDIPGLTLYRIGENA